MAQTARALHWIVKTLRDGGLGSGEDAPTLGEWWLHFESGLCGEQREADIGGCCWAWRKAAMHVPSAAEAPSPYLTQRGLPMGNLAQDPILFLCLMLQRGHLQEVYETQTWGLSDRKPRLCC